MLKPYPSLQSQSLLSPRRLPPSPVVSAASVPRAQPLHGIEVNDFPVERKRLLNHFLLTMQKYYLISQLINNTKNYRDSPWVLFKMSPILWASFTHNSQSTVCGSESLKLAPNNSSPPCTCISSCHQEGRQSLFSCPLIWAVLGRTLTHRIWQKEPLELLKPGLQKNGSLCVSSLWKPAGRWEVPPA